MHRNRCANRNVHIRVRRAAGLDAVEPILVVFGNDAFGDAVEFHVQRLIPLAAQRDLYAPLQGVEAISAFLAALGRLIQAHLDSHRPNSVQKDVEVCLRALQHAANSLVELARDHLGLEKLPEGAMESDTRFAGSFRGHDVGPHRAAIQREQR